MSYEKPREFYVQETLVTEGQKVVRRLSAQYDANGLASDAYHHGDEYWRVIDKKAYDELEAKLKILKETRRYCYVKELEGELKDVRASNRVLADMVNESESKLKEWKKLEAVWMQMANTGQGQLDLLNAQLKIATKALESIDWITRYSDGSKDNCKASRELVKKALEKG